MRQFDLCQIKPQSDVSMIVVLQHDWLDEQQTVVVAPVVLASRHLGSLRLHPQFEMAGETYLIALNLLATIPRRSIGQTLRSLASHRDAIKRGLDTLFDGF